MAYIDDIKKNSMSVGSIEYNNKLGGVYCSHHKSNYYVFYDVLAFVEETKNGLRLPAKLMDKLNGGEIRNHFQKDGRLGYNIIQVIGCENEGSFNDSIANLKKMKVVKFNLDDDKLKEFKASIVADAI